MIAPPRIYSLSDVTQAVENALKEPMKKTFWVQAEVTEAKMSGVHLYAILAEVNNGELIAKMRCQVWNPDLKKIQRSFKTAGIDFELRQGMKVCLQCRISFHAVHGLSLVVMDADPRFVLGELELQKRLIIEKLVQEGADKINKRLAVPVLTLRLGLITGKDSAAGMDILKTLKDSRFGFQVFFAEAYVQGENTESSILRALDALERLKPDVIILARGGGSRTDLAWLDTEAVARRIAACSIPVWTAIGHETDSGIPDIVAHASFKTPTAVAEEIVSRFVKARRFVDHATEVLRREWSRGFARQRTELDDNRVGIAQGTRKLKDQKKTALLERGEKLRILVDQRLSKNHERNILASEKLHTRTSNRIRLSKINVVNSASRMKSSARVLHREGLSQLSGYKQRISPARLTQLLERRRQTALYALATFQRSARLICSTAENRLETLMHRLLRGNVLLRLEGHGSRLDGQFKLLAAHDPLTALSRGYAIVHSEKNEIITSVASLYCGMTVRIMMRDGTATSTIQTVEESHVGTEYDLRTESGSFGTNPDAP